MKIPLVSSLKAQSSKLKDHLNFVNVIIQKRVRKQLSVLLASFAMMGAVQAEEIYQPCANFSEYKGENCIAGTSTDPVTCMPVVTMDCTAPSGINLQSSIGDSNFKHYNTIQTSIPTVTENPIVMNDEIYPAGSPSKQITIEEYDELGNLVDFNEYELPNN